MEYTQSMYEEDKAISRWVFSKKFKTLTCYKDDLIQSAIIALYNYRSKYDESKSSYFTYASYICYFFMLKFLKKEKKFTNNFTNCSIDFEFDDDFSFYDILGYEVDFDKNFNYDFLLKVCHKVIDKHKSETLKKIAKLFLLGKKQIQIAKELNVTRQCVNSYINKFRQLVINKLKEYDFELQTNICNKKVIQK